MKWLAWLKKIADLFVGLRQAGLLDKKNGPGGPTR